VGNSTP